MSDTHKHAHDSDGDHGHADNYTKDPEYPMWWKILSFVIVVIGAVLLCIIARFIYSRLHINVVMDSVITGFIMILMTLTVTKTYTAIRNRKKKKFKAVKLIAPIAILLMVPGVIGVVTVFYHHSGWLVIFSVLVVATYYYLLAFYTPFTELIKGFMNYQGGDGSGEQVNNITPRQEVEILAKRENYEY